MTRQCAICGTPVPPGKDMDSLVDLGWRALQEGRGPRHYFCSKHSAKEVVAWFAGDSKTGRILRGEVPRASNQRANYADEH